ncbi:hypothetical protein O0L34_g6652 [Tuta absoluta]|nr:hypothetical protein O0L34_g6652 [Tuta absoluta]
MEFVDLVETNIRKRTLNYSQEEKEILTQLVERYRSRIENKRTDTAANADKARCWLQIADEFNATTSSHIYRTPANLKGCWRRAMREQRQNKTDSNPVQKLLADHPHQLLKFEISEESLHKTENVSDDEGEMNESTPIGSIDDHSHDSTQTGNIEDTGRQRNVNEQDRFQSTEEKTTFSNVDPTKSSVSNVNPTESTVRSRLDKLREAQLELVRLKMEIARKELKFMEAEHKIKMQHLVNEERRKEEIHGLIKKKITLNNTMEL